MRKKLILLIIFLAAILVRSLYFKEAVTFGYDQARDAFNALEIWQEDHFKILGPRTDLDGIYHGPLYWYLISPFYYFTQGSIWNVRLFLIIFNSLTIFLIYDLTKRLFKSKKTALLASAFYALSFEAVQYGRWLSNPSPAIVTITLSFWALWRLIEGEVQILPLLIFAWGLSTQFQFFMIYQGLAFLIIWLLAQKPKRKKIPIKTITLSFLAAIAAFFPFLAAELKFNFQGIRSFIRFSQKQTHFGDSFVKIASNYLNRFSQIFFFNLWGVNLFLAGIAGIITICLAVKLTEKKQLRNQALFLSSWIISPIILHFFGGTDAVFINLGAGIGAIILSSHLINRLLKNKRIKYLYFLAIFIIISGNLGLIISQNKNGETLFSVQKRMILGDELRVIDWVYDQSRGKAFKINTITNPLFINSTWSYLFDWYGKNKYGYMPIWWGETQVGVPGEKVKFSQEKETDLHFLIIEPGPSIPEEYLFAIRKLEDTRSEVVEIKKIGNFIIEKRKITRPRIFTSQDVFQEINPQEKTSSLEN